MNQKKFRVGGNLLQEWSLYKGQAARRRQALAGAQAPEGGQEALGLARLLYPARQHVVVKKIETQREDYKTFWLGPDQEAGQSELAPFLPGQHLALTALVEGSPVSRPYSLMSSPAQARQGLYGLTIKAQGLLSRYLVEQAKVGDRFTLTGPEGDFTWQPLRDAPHLVALASGSGVAAFLSMARAVREGDLNLRMTLLYTCPWQDGFLHKKELDGLQGSGVEVRYFCPDCPDGSLEPLNAAQVDRAAGQEPYSLFWCGSPEAMAAFEKLIPQLKTKPQSLRAGEGSVWCAPQKGKGFRLRVHARTVTYTIEALPGETLLTAMERAGIAAPAPCRAGRCGFCRSRLIRGGYRVAPGFEGRLKGEEAEWLHPCCTYPEGDMEFEIYPV